MLFNSFVFLFAFLPVTYSVFWLLRSARARYAWLAVTGYVFYGYWNPWFCILMGFSTVVSFLAGLGFLRWSDHRHRRVCLVVPIVTDLCLLGFFKYANFGLESARDILGLLGSKVWVPQYNIILPIGISFYTFHTISYIVDSYRGTIRPTRNFFEFAAYVSLFSQLVAGPIVRFRQIETDLENLGVADRSRWFWRGVYFFAVGLVQKVIIADGLAAFVDPALAHYEALSTVGAWSAVLGYSFQLFFDFAGYSAMAVGLGLLFGLRIPQNFNSPYKATDPSDFWRRWHISLSSCLRDYVYIPLGGNRDGENRAYRNLVLTMLIGGLWHGAAWTFVAWGAYHGLLLALYRRYGAVWNRLSRPVRQAGTFLLVVIGWVFFRARSFRMAGKILRTMFVPQQGVGIDRPTLFAALLALAGVLALAAPNEFEVDGRVATWKPRHAYALAAVLGACMAIMAGGGSSPFLYFQF
jgi:alginate O-acetyltransferase complex protein AlgI